MRTDPLHVHRREVLKAAVAAIGRDDAAFRAAMIQLKRIDDQTGRG